MPLHKAGPVSLCIHWRWSEVQDSIAWILQGIQGQQKQIEAQWRQEASAWKLGQPSSIPEGVHKDLDFGDRKRSLLNSYKTFFPPVDTNFKN